MTKIPSVEERVDKVFQEVMTDIGKYYKVSDRLSDILSDSLGEQLTQALTAQREAGAREERERIEMELMNAEKHSHPGEQGLFVPWTSIKTALNPPTK